VTPISGLNTGTDTRFVSQPPDVVQPSLLHVAVFVNVAGLSGAGPPMPTRALRTSLLAPAATEVTVQVIWPPGAWQVAVFMGYQQRGCWA
jgi:hypothetical protein